MFFVYDTLKKSNNIAKVQHATSYYCTAFRNELILRAIAKQCRMQNEFVATRQAEFELEIAAKKQQFWEKSDYFDHVKATNKIADMKQADYAIVAATYMTALRNDLSVPFCN